MPHRSDLEAAHARIAALERELAAAAGPPGRRSAPSPPRIPQGFELREQSHRLRIAWNAPDEPGPTGGRAFVFLGLAIALVLGIQHDQLLITCITGAVAGLGVLAFMGGRVEIEVNGDRLRVASSPVTSREDRLLWRDEIGQLYCVLRQGPARASYELWCHLASGERLCLVRALASAEGAEFLEHALERRLGLPAGR
jgi:hypothetical protein